MLTLRFMTNYALIAIGIAGLAVCFGGMMGTYPALVLDYFGPKHISTNYAFIFLAYGIGSALATVVGTFSMNQFGSYDMAFTVIGISCALGVVMSLMSKRPVKG
jgi:OFA family oxalate/formate antiporter-like MFS transporter